MTMAFSADTLNGISDNSTASAAVEIQMNNNDLNLDKILRETASATVKFLLKRNANTDINKNIDNSHDDAIVHDDVDYAVNGNDVVSKTEYTAMADNNLSATITSIRSNVTKVLYMYFQNKTTDTDDMPTNEANTYDTDTNLTQLPANESPLATAMSTLSRIATTMTSEILHNSTYNNNSNLAHIAAAATTTSTTAATPIDNNNLDEHNSNVIVTTMTHLNEFLNATTTTPTNTTTTAAAEIATITTNATIAPSITYPSIAINSYENCSALFANYTQPQPGLFCNWVWDRYLCWPPTPAGVLARMNCPSGFHGVDAKKFAHRQCELNGHWGSKPNETLNPIGWTDYNPCWKQEVKTLMDKVSNLELVLEIARRTRTLEIVGLILSLVALIISLIIFCNFRSLRNNRTKIHKNLFMAMVLQVVIRLTLYLDQAYRRDSQETTSNNSLSGIENTPYWCEASYVLLEYAKTAMFMWMFIEGWYLHNMVTVTVFQGRFPYKLFFMVGWGMPVLMTAIWATCTAIYYAASTHDCWWNYNLTPYYWILEGPRIIVITINFGFLLNIIRVLVVKLRESQASDIEQTRKAVRAAIVLLPLLGTINVLYLIPALETPWKFALWSYVTHFLTTFQGFFIALLYCFLNGEVRAVLLKSLAVFMSLRGHPEWVPKRASMYSAAYNTAPDTENHAPDNKRNESPSSRRLNGRKASCSTVIHQTANKSNPKIQISPRLSHSNASSLSAGLNHHNHRLSSLQSNNNNAVGSLTNLHTIGRQPTQQQHHRYARRHNWMLSMCFRGQKVLRVPPASSEPPESVVFELSEQ
ncbi:PDF receptor isoform X2 [Calliphora vicina]|uniref:PDF receptor isoform X2 n=1 Tax=Calliphora vicina TaxID=7373 RepID=UPI00325B4B61